MDSRNHKFSLRFLQWNARGISSKKGDLIHISHQYDVIAILESWLNPNFYFSFPGFHIQRKDSFTKKSSGLCFLIRHGIQYSIEPNIFNLNGLLDTFGVRIHTLQGSLVIVALYKNPSFNIKYEHWIQVFSSLRKADNIIFAGDFNSHNPSWGCSIADSAGKSLEKAASDCHLCILNNGMPTRITPPSQNVSAIDLTLVNPGLLPHCVWNVLDDAMGSDHFPVETTIHISNIIYSRFLHRVDSTSTNWISFKKILRNQEESITSKINDDSLNIEEKVSLLTSFLIDAVTSSNPHASNTKNNLRVSKTPPSSPWWNEDCAKQFADRKFALKQYRTNPSYENYLNLRKHEALAKKTFKAAKRDSWRNYCENIDFHTSPGKIWRAIKSFKNRSLAPNNSSPTVDMDEASRVISTLCPDYCPPQILFQDTPLPPNNDLLGRDISEEEVSEVIIRLNPRSSPGLDGISYRIIQNMPIYLHKLLVNIYNNILLTGTYPLAWRTVLVFLIPKSTPGKLRPISLTSCLLKIMEKVLATRLQWWTESNLIISSTQFGFRRGKSCFDNLALLTTEIQTGITLAQYTPCLFIDIKGAFDNLLPELLVHILRNLNIPERFVRFIFNLTSFRMLRFMLNNNLSEPYYTYKGVPQGSVLSPILFNLYVNNLSSHLYNNCKLLQFADDTVIYARGHDIDNLLHDISISANQMCASLEDLGLQISSSKSSLVIFTRKRIDPRSYSIEVKKSLINSVERTKFLGIILDYKLNGQSHINFLHSKGIKLLNIIKMLRGVWWGAHPSSLMTIYKMIIRASIEYGCFVFAGSSESSFYKLERIQLQAIRLALGLRSTTPTNIILAEANEPTLYSRFLFLTGKYLLKVFSITKHPLIRKLVFLNDMAIMHTRHNTLNSFILLRVFLSLRNNITLIKHYDIIPSCSISYEALIWSPPVRITNSANFVDSPDPNATFKDLYGNLNEDKAIFYTDGSKRKDPGCYVGLSSFSPSLDHTLYYKISSKASIFTAEGTAISITLDRILDNSIADSIIFTDSLSIIKAISNCSPYSAKNEMAIHLKKKLYDAHSKGLNIELIWIPAHKGIYGNETADFFAKFAIGHGNHLQVRIPYTDLHPFLREKKEHRLHSFIEKWKNRKGINYFKYYYVSGKPWFSSFPKLNRSIITSCIRLRSGHYNLNASLARFHIIDSPRCNCGHHNQDLDHVIWSCTLLIAPRRIFVSALVKAGFSPPFSLTQLFKYPSINSLTALDVFLRQSKLTL